MKSSHLGVARLAALISSVLLAAVALVLVPAGSALAASAQLPTCPTGSTFNATTHMCESPASQVTTCPVSGCDPVPATFGCSDGALLYDAMCYVAGSCPPDSIYALGWCNLAAGHQDVTCPDGYFPFVAGPLGDVPTCARFPHFPQEYSCPDGTTLNENTYCDPVMTTTYSCAAGTLEPTRNVCQQAPLPPSSVNQCKNNGYKNYGTRYPNQGACVSAIVPIKTTG